MKSLRIIPGLVFVCTLAVAVGVYAQKKERPQKGDRPMLKCEDRFAEMDANKDGKIDMKEFTSREHPKEGPRGKDFKRRGKGGPEEFFKARDKNNDGFLDKEEFCAKDDRKRKPRGRKNY